MEPATNLGRSGIAISSAASRAMRAAARLISRARWPRPYSLRTMGVEPKLFVSMMSAPASSMLRWMPLMASGLVRTRCSLQPSYWGPPKSPAVRSRAWMLVPMAPSRMTMRCWSRRFRASMRAGRGSGMGGTPGRMGMADSQLYLGRPHPGLRPPLSHWERGRGRGPNPQISADLEEEKPPRHEGTMRMVIIPSRQVSQAGWLRQEAYRTENFRWIVKADNLDSVRERASSEPRKKLTRHFFVCHNKRTCLHPLP